MTTRSRDWAEETQQDAVDLILEGCLDEVVDLLMEGSELPLYYSQYDGADAHMHESVDCCICDIAEAADLIQTYWTERETDSGLWDPKDPCEAILVQAHYTYQNVVAGKFTWLMKELNRDKGLGALLGPGEDGLVRASRDDVEARVREVVALL